MNLKPLHDRIIVELAEHEEMSAGGILLPDSAKEKPMRGKVLAVGPGKTLDNGKLVKVDIGVGDIVLFGKYSGTEVTVGSEEYTILRQEDVLAIVEGETAKKKEMASAKS